MRGAIFAALLLAAFLNVASAAEQIILPAGDGKPILPLPNDCRHYRTLLALDGGGMRGIVTTQTLKMLEASIKDFLVNHPEVTALLDDTTRFATKNDFHIDLADYFDGVAGISAGSWMATYIASKGGTGRQSSQIFEMEHIKRRFGDVRPGSVQGLEVYFMEYGVYIYPPNVLFGMVKPRFWDPPEVKMDFVTRAGYRPAGLEWTLDKFLGDSKFSELPTSLFIAAFDLNIRASVQFVADRIAGLPNRARLRAITRNTETMNHCIDRIKNYEASETKKKATLDRIKRACDLEALTGMTVADPDHVTVRTGYVWTRTIPRDVKTEDDYLEPGLVYHSGMDYNLKDIARASSAFPMIHPAKNIKPFFDMSHEYDLIDGAMVGNNPTFQALIWMSSNVDIELIDIAVLSIGTGCAVTDFSYLGEAGFLQWRFPMMMLIMDSSAEFIQSNLDFLFYESMKTLTRPNQYLRVQTVGEGGTPEGTALSSVNDVTLLPELRKLGVETAIRYKASIEAFVRDFLFARCTDKRYEEMEDERERRMKEPFEKAKASYTELLQKISQ